MVLERGPSDRAQTWALAQYDLPNPQAHLAMEHLEPIFRRPDEMVAMRKCRVTTATVAHSLTESKAQASIRLKPEGFLPVEDYKK